ncbi:MAG: DUF4331 domain-containing protein [Gemmatimonadota bacterium]|nr:DUF4331 domain-containing protein [Gemmatimonadota bacterium]
MRHGFISRGAVRRIIGPALAIGLLASTACGSDNNGSTGPSTREYNQVQRLGNPLVSEVFLAKKDHAFHGSVGPAADVAAFAPTVKAFPAAFGRDAVIGNTLASVLLPDMLIVQLDKDGASAGWLSWALADGYGGRKLSDDVVDAGLTAIFGPLLGDPTHKVCNNFALPLCTDNVADPGRHTDAFPYLKPPA